MAQTFLNKFKQTAELFQNSLIANDIKEICKNSMAMRYHLSLLNDNEIFQEKRQNKISEDQELITQTTIFSQLIAGLREKISEDLAQSYEGRLLLLNAILPIEWNTNTDWVFVAENLKNKNEILNTLSDIGQKQIITEISLDNHKTFVFNKKEDIEDYLLNLKNPPKQVIAIYDNENPNIEFIDFYKHTKNFCDQSRMIENTYKNQMFEYDKEQIKNINFFIGAQPVHNLKSFISKKDILIISPGPSLDDNIEELKKFYKNYITIAVAQACPALTKNNITPNFILVLDPLDYSKSLHGIKVESVDGLIVSTQVHLNFLNKNFKNIFFWETSTSVFNFEQYLKIGSIPFGGGSVSISALSLAINFNAKSITIVGQDLCLADKRRYSSHIKSGVNGPSDIISIKTSPFGFKYMEDESGLVIQLQEVDCIDEKKRYSPQDYYQYLFQIENLVRDIKIPLINLSKSGAIISGFQPGEIQTQCLIDPIIGYQDNDKNVRIYKNSYFDFLVVKRRNLIHFKKIVHNITKILSKKYVNFKAVDKVEKNIMKELPIFPEINDSMFPFVKKFERLFLQEEENIENNIRFSLALYKQMQSICEIRLENISRLIMKLK